MVNFTHRLYDKRPTRVRTDFPIVNFPYLSSINIPEAPAYGILVSQLIRYALVCSEYYDEFTVSILVSNLLKQGYYSRKL